MSSIDTSQAHSIHQADELERQQAKGPAILDADGKPTRSDESFSYSFDPHGYNPTDMQIENMRRSFRNAFAELQRATAAGFESVAEETKEYYVTMNRALEAVLEKQVQLECVLDSLIKMLLVAQEMPPDVLAEHKTQIAQFLQRHVPKTQTNEADSTANTQVQSG